MFDAAPGSVVVAPQGSGGNYIIARLTGIAHPQNAVSQEVYRQRPRCNCPLQAADDFTTAYANAARMQQGVTVNQKLLQQATGGAS